MNNFYFKSHYEKRNCHFNIHKCILKNQAGVYNTVLKVLLFDSVAWDIPVRNMIGIACHLWMDKGFMYFAYGYMSKACLELSIHVFEFSSI